MCSAPAHGDNHAWGNAWTLFSVIWITDLCARGRRYRGQDMHEVKNEDEYLRRIRAEILCIPPQLSMGIPLVFSTIEPYMIAGF